MDDAVAQDSRCSFRSGNGDQGGSAAELASLPDAVRAIVEECKAQTSKPTSTGVTEEEEMPYPCRMYEESAPGEEDMLQLQWMRIDVRRSAAKRLSTLQHCLRILCMTSAERISKFKSDPISSMSSTSRCPTWTANTVGATPAGKGSTTVDQIRGWSYPLYTASIQLRCLMKIAGDAQIASVEDLSAPNVEVGFTTRQREI